ncbi:MAG TPA: hypothetical protein VGL02_20465 [Streptomyces sp.]
MRHADSPSWSFTEGNPWIFHLALFVRDATHLPVPPSPDVPPPLLTRPEPVGVPLSVDTGAAAEQWLAWWRRIVRLEVNERWRGLFHPPGFDSLAQSPDLRSLLTAHYLTAAEWCDATRTDGRRPGPDGYGAFPWRQVNDVAEEIAATLAVSPGAVKGAVRVLDVEGVWAFAAGPGSLLCSAGAAAEAEVRARLLRETFVSGTGA